MQIKEGELRCLQLTDYSRLYPSSCRALTNHRMKVKECCLEIIYIFVKLKTLFFTKTKFNDSFIVACLCVKNGVFVCSACIQSVGPLKGVYTKSSPPGRLVHSGTDSTFL